MGDVRATIATAQQQGTSATSTAGHQMVELSTNNLYTVQMVNTEQMFDYNEIITITIRACFGLTAENRQVYTLASE